MINSTLPGGKYSLANWALIGGSGGFVDDATCTVFMDGESLVCVKG